MATNYISGVQITRNLGVTASLTAGKPVKIGTNLMGTLLDDADSDDKAVVDVSTLSTYAHSVRNVLTYNGGAEATFAAATEGRDVYYDASSTMPTGVYLSFSPLDKDGGTNKKFGKVMGGLDATATAKTMLLVEVLQDRS